MDFQTNILSFIIFISFILVLLFLYRRDTISGLIRKSTHAPWNLDYFLKHRNRSKIGERYYLFSEQSVFSKQHRITGRFDGAILHWDTVPILDAIIERKFPVRILPTKVREEDIFQAGLYALALMDCGISTKSTKLVVIHCLQEKALKCVQKSRGAYCFSCENSRIFSKHFNPSRVMQELSKLDEIWFTRRKPRASPSSNKCRVCPYSKTKCKYSKA